MELDVEQWILRCKLLLLNYGMKQKQESRFSPSNAGECDSYIKKQNTKSRKTVHDDMHDGAHTRIDKQYTADTPKMIQRK